MLLVYISRHSGTGTECTDTGTYATDNAGTGTGNFVFVVVKIIGTKLCKKKFKSGWNF